MGHKHSASVSSGCLYQIAEKELCTVDSLAARGIALYVRYHDDILVLANSALEGKKFMDRFRELASRCYVVELHDVS